MNHDLLKILSILIGGKTFRMRGKGVVKKGENLPFPVDDLRGKVLDAAGVSVEEQGKLLRKAIVRIRNSSQQRRDNTSVMMEL